MSARRRRQRGFTLLELVLAIGVIAIMGIGLAALLVTTARAQATAINAADVADAGTLASDMIALDLREMRAPASVGLIDMLPGELRFVDWSGKTIRYRLVAGRLLRSENGGVERVAAAGVTAFTVIYRRANGTVAAARHEVGRIDYGLTVARGAESRIFSNEIYPRAFTGVVADWREQ